MEEALLEHPAVAAAGVVGRPDEAHGEEVVAFVELGSGQEVEPDELVAWSKERIGGTSTRARSMSFPRCR